MSVNPANPHVLIAVSRFYEDISDQLLLGAKELLEEKGATYEVIDVPGAFELPAAVRFASLSETFDGYIALGCVVRGETSHYEHVCNESARGLSDLAVRFQLAVGYGILTTDTREQAWHRASVRGSNKGRDVAEACLRMVDVRRQFLVQE